MYKKTTSFTSFYEVLWFFVMICSAHFKWHQLWFRNDFNWMSWCIFKPNRTNICNVFLRWQAESGQVLCIALSKTRLLLSLHTNTNQTARGGIKIDTVRPTLKCTRTQTIQKLSATHSNRVNQYFKSNHLETRHLITSILETRQSWCLICRKTESKASWLACWLSLVRAALGSANRLELPVPFSCKARGKRCRRSLFNAPDNM